MHEHLTTLQAPVDSKLSLWVEPWAAALAFPPGTTVELRAQSELAGEIEIDAGPERTAVYGWSGSTLQVIVKGEIVRSFDTPAPNIPINASMKHLMTQLFGPPPMPDQKR